MRSLQCHVGRGFPIVWFRLGARLAVAVESLETQLVGITGSACCDIFDDGPDVVDAVEAGCRCPLMPEDASRVEVEDSRVIGSRVPSAGRPRYSGSASGAVAP